MTVTKTGRLWPIQLAARLLVAHCALAADCALAQEFPDPNPVPQTDGTFHWYVGNNTQYPVIQDVLDVCADGDEVIVRDGIYVESLEIDNEDVTLRPFVYLDQDIPSWESVIFLNPTQGFENDNGWSIKISGSRGSYIGRPRQITELANGSEVQTLIQPRDQISYEPVGQLVEVGFIEDAEYAVGNGQFEDGVICFQSRSAGDVAIASISSSATIDGAVITSMQGFGGGLMIYGSNNQTAFVDCTLTNLQANGEPHELLSDLPVCVVNISGDQTTRPTFHQVRIASNFGSSYAVVQQSGADSSWNFCQITGNHSNAAMGTFASVGGRGSFSTTLFSGNVSGEGTFYWDATGTGVTDEFRFYNCCFIENSTVSNLYGGVGFIEHDGLLNLQPKLIFSGCAFVFNNGLDFPSPTDPNDSGIDFDGDYAIRSPYLPEYRIGIPNTNQCLGLGSILLPAGDINQDGVVDVLDLCELIEVIGYCPEDLDLSGEVDYYDLLLILTRYGQECY